jgi:pyruvate-formate lyase
MTSTEATKMVGSKTAMEWRDSATAEVGCTERVRKLNRMMHSFRPSVDLHRTRCFTKVYKELDGCTEKRKMYFAMAETIATLPVNIYDHERILGWQGKKPRAENFNVEMHGHWMEPELDEIPTREFDPFELSEEDKKELAEEHLPFWAPRCLAAKWAKRVPNPEKLTSSGIADCINYIHNAGSHFLPDYPELFRTGYKGLYEKARKCLNAIDANDPGSIERKDFYEGMVAVLKAIKKLADRYSKAAQKMAEHEKNRTRKEELMKAAEVLAKVPWNPPTTFYEGLQTVWFTQLLLNIDGAGPSNSMGRFDQFMYPLYKADVEAGRLDPDSAREWLEEFYIKLTNVTWLLPTQLASYFGGYYRFQQLDVGGVDRDGNDASNELSRIVFQAMREVHTTAPNVALLLHPKTPELLQL